jgi:hypothetical protein
MEIRTMAKAKVVKSKRGRDLVQLTIGPKEAGKLNALLYTSPTDDNLDAVLSALEGARAIAANSKAFEISEPAMVEA